MDPVCLISKLGLKPSELTGSVQYAFDFSGRGKLIIEPFLHDFSNETIFYLDYGRPSFDFKELESLLSNSEEISRSDIILVRGSVSQITGQNEYSTGSSHEFETYFLNAGDIERIETVCPQSQRMSYTNHSVVLIGSFNNGRSYAADIGL